jgi:hypothetical protein
LGKAPKKDKGVKVFEDIARYTTERGPVHVLTDRNFTKFVSDKPRYYHAALFMTASDAKYGCAPCNAAQKAFEDMAGQYHNQYELRNVPPEQRVAFFVLDVDSARTVFDSLKMETVPRLFVMPPKLTADGPGHKASDFEVPTGSLLNGMTVLLGELQRVTGGAISVQPTTDPLPIILGMSLLAGIAAYLVNKSEGQFGKLYSLALSPSLWIWFSLICFTFGVSGSVYCIIRNTPAYSVGRDGRFSLFSDQSRDQTVLEGLTIALFTLGFALSMYLAHVAASTPMLSFDPKVIWKNAVGKIVRAVIVSAALALLLVSFNALWDSYIFKTQWYRVSETMPGYVWKPFTDKVVRSSGLLKRLQKLSTIFVYEFKTWDAFMKNCDTYLFKFLKRSVRGA